MKDVYKRTTDPASDEDIENIEADTARGLSREKFRGQFDEFDALLYCGFHSNSVPRQVTGALNKTSMGVLDASILAALSLVQDDSHWGIVTKSSFLQDHITDAVYKFLGQQPSTQNARFKGVFAPAASSSVSEKSEKDQDQDSQLFEAAKRLFQTGNVACVIMGATDFRGMAPIIRRAASDVYGPDRGWGVFIVNPLHAGVDHLRLQLRARYSYRQAQR